MLKQLLFSAVLTILPALAFSQDAVYFECSSGDLTRRLNIVSEPGVSVPCEVHYYKDNEVPGEHQVLWRATNEDGYCEARADEFRLKLVEWGWDCGTAGAALPAEPMDDATDDGNEDSMADSFDEAVEDSVDDTDVLAPAPVDGPGEQN